LRVGRSDTLSPFFFNLSLAGHPSKPLRKSASQSSWPVPDVQRPPSFPSSPVRLEAPLAGHDGDRARQERLGKDRLLMDTPSGSTPPLFLFPSFPFLLSSGGSSAAGNGPGSTGRRRAEQGHQSGDTPLLSLFFPFFSPARDEKQALDEGRTWGNWEKSKASRSIYFPSSSFFFFFLSLPPLMPNSPGPKPSDERMGNIAGDGAKEMSLPFLPHSVLAPGVAPVPRRQDRQVETGARFPPLPSPPSFFPHLTGSRGRTQRRVAQAGGKAGGRAFLPFSLPCVAVPIVAGDRSYTAPSAESSRGRPETERCSGKLSPNFFLLFTVRAACGSIRKWDAWIKGYPPLPPSPEHLLFEIQNGNDGTEGDPSVLFYSFPFFRRSGTVT